MEEAVPADVELLVREAVSPDLLPSPKVLDELDRLEPADRLRLVDELLGRHLLHPAEERPPHRLVLAPMPAEELSEQPSTVPLGRPVDPVVRHVRCQAVDELLDARLRLGQLRRQLPLTWRRARDGEAGQHGELEPKALEPILKALIAADIVAVVPLDPDEMVRRGPIALAELEPFLERDDARTRVAQVDLAFEPVEPLHLLDRVALDGRPHRLT